MLQEDGGLDDLHFYNYFFLKAVKVKYQSKSYECKIIIFKLKKICIHHLKKKLISFFA